MKKERLSALPFTKEAAVLEEKISAYTETEVQVQLSFGEKSDE